MSIEETVEERVGGYRLLERVGEGGMGVVYRAVPPFGGQDVAVKVFKPEFARDRDFRRRLEREVETMRRIRSPHVVGVLDADLGADRPYIVTTFVDGRTLEEIVRAAGPLTRPALERVATGLARALVAIHAAGVVHRDLKPNNVMLVRGEPVVIDFGIAHAADSTRLTRTGMIVGTPGYLAPEVIDGERPGPAVDVYAWGGTLAFAATARQPFGTGSLQAILARIVSGRPDLDGIPEGLSDAVSAALSKDPAQRPSASQLVTWLTTAGAYTSPTFTVDAPASSTATPETDSPAAASFPPPSSPASASSPSPRSQASASSASRSSASTSPASTSSAARSSASMTSGPGSAPAPAELGFSAAPVDDDEVGEWSAAYARPKLDPVDGTPSSSDAVESPRPDESPSPDESQSPDESARSDERPLRDTSTSAARGAYRQIPPQNAQSAAPAAPPGHQAPPPPGDQPSPPGTRRGGKSSSAGSSPGGQPFSAGMPRADQPSASTPPWSSPTAPSSAASSAPSSAAARPVGDGWYKLIGYLVILILVAWTVEIPGFFGLWVCGAAWYLRAGDAALHTLPPPGRDWRAFAMAPLRRPGTLVMSAFTTGFTLVGAMIAGAVVSGILDAPGSTLGGHVASSWGVAAAAYLMLAGPKVMAPRRHLVRLVWAATPRWETTRTVAIVAAALALVFGMTAAADPGAPHWRGGSTRQGGGASVSGRHAPWQPAHGKVTESRKRRKAFSG